MNEYRNETFDQERAFYGQDGVTLTDCVFDGPADGESALKECTNLTTDKCLLNLRYPFWHDDEVLIENSTMTENCRAALWYSKRIRIRDSKLNGIKALRECEDVKIERSQIQSAEFGWSVRNIQMSDTDV